MVTIHLKEKMKSRTYLSSLPLSDIFLGLVLGVFTRCRTSICKQRNNPQYLNIFFIILLILYMSVIDNGKNTENCTEDGDLHVSKLPSSSELNTRIPELQRTQMVQRVNYDMHSFNDTIQKLHLKKIQMMLHGLHFYTCLFLQRYMVSVR